MEQSVSEECDLIALKVYAIQLGISKGRVMCCITKEAIYNLISEKLNQILEENKTYPTSTYQELCAFAESIGANTILCGTNNIPCVLSAIHQRILSLYDSALLFNLNFNDYINNLKELHKLAKEREDTAFEDVSKRAKKYIENNQNSTNNNGMKP